MYCTILCGAVHIVPTLVNHRHKVVSRYFLGANPLAGVKPQTPDFCAYGVLLAKSGSPG